MADIDYTGTINLVVKGKPTEIISNLISKITLDLPEYADNAAAVAGGLSSGQLYRNGGDPDTICVVS